MDIDHLLTLPWVRTAVTVRVEVLLNCKPGFKLLRNPFVAPHPRVPRARSRAVWHSYISSDPPLLLVLWVRPRGVVFGTQ